MSCRAFGLAVSDVEICVFLPTCPLNVWINDEGIKPAVLSHAMGK